MKSNRRQWISEDTPILLGVIGGCGFCLAMMFGALLILFMPNLRINPDFYFLSAAFFLVTTNLIAVIVGQREKIKRWILRTVDLFIVILICISFLFKLVPDDEVDLNID